MGRAVGCTVAFSILLAAIAAAQASLTPEQSRNPVKELTLEQLGDVEVTSVSKAPEQVWKTPAAIYVITQEDIQRSGVTTIPDALRLAPGVQVAEFDSSHWAVGIRGFASQFSRSVLVLIDGRSVYTPLFAGVYWDVQNVMLEDVDRIEVMRGPGGTIWGANAVNGVINIITKRAQDTQGSLATTLSGNVDRSQSGVRYGGVVRNNFNYRVYAMGFNRGAEFHPDNDSFDDWWNVQGGFRMDWANGSRDSFTFQGDMYEGSEGERKQIGVFVPPQQLTLDGIANVSGGNLLARWKRQIDADSDLQIQAYVDRTNRQDLQFGETRDTIDVDAVYHKAVNERNDLIVGMGLRWSPSLFIQSIPTLTFLPRNQLDQLYSVFLQDTYQLIANRVSITAGTKLEHNNYSGFEYQPSGRILWTPKQHASFWASVTRAVRTPSRIDQDIHLTGVDPSVPLYLTINGSPNFRSEVLIASELGYRQLVDRNFYVDVSSFYNHYRDLESYGSLVPGIAPPPLPPILQYNIAYINGIQGHTLGVEIAPDWQPTHWWDLKGSYSYIHLSLRDQPGVTDTGTVLSYEGSTPQHGLQIQSKLNLPKRFQFDQVYRYAGALSSQNIRGYQTMDARLGWQSGFHLEFSAVGQNLFQPQHVEFTGDPGPSVGIKRSVYGQITWKR
jgi:iron complex outermembrane receptor protein